MTNQKFKPDWKYIGISILCIIAMTVLFSLFSCTRHDENNFRERIISDFEIIEFDGCEYIDYKLGVYGGLLTHKGNCKYCSDKK